MSDKLYMIHRSKAEGGPIGVKETDLTEGQLVQFKNELEEVWDKMPKAVKEVFLEEKVNIEMEEGEKEENPEPEPVPEKPEPKSKGKGKKKTDEKENSK